MHPSARRLTCHRPRQSPTCQAHRRKKRRNSTLPLGARAASPHARWGRLCGFSPYSCSLQPSGTASLFGGKIAKLLAIFSVLFIENSPFCCIFRAELGDGEENDHDKVAERLVVYRCDGQCRPDVHLHSGARASTGYGGPQPGLRHGIVVHSRGRRGLLAAPAPKARAKLSRWATTEDERHREKCRTTSDDTGELMRQALCG
jgi:hypothetical protein